MPLGLHLVNLLPTVIIVLVVVAMVAGMFSVALRSAKERHDADRRR